MNKYWYEEAQKFGSIPQDTMLSTSGLILLKKIVKGELPQPTISKAMNFYMAEASEGRMVFRGAPLDEHYNPAGTVHGGWYAAILDSALFCCVWTKVPIGQFATTVEIKVNLIRPMTQATGEVISEANVVHIGRTIATSEATLKTPDGKLIAHGTSTCAIIDPSKG